MISNLVLVGPMGAGKSTIGKLLASRLKWNFLDTDTVIEERTGADIPWIFDVEGEEGFRNRESAVLQDVLTESETIIATGGGIVLRQANRDLLRNESNVIYLTATIDQLVERTCKDKKRPLLQVQNPRAKIVELFELRDPLYREVAAHIVATDGRSPKHVVSDITRLFDL